MIALTIDTRRARVTEKEIITIGSVGIQVQFTFSDDWDGLSRIACFMAGTDGEQTEIALPSTNTCVIPSALLVDANEDEPLMIGAFGVNTTGSIVIPTVWASAGIIRDGVDAAVSTQPPSPEDYWSSVLALATEATDTADEAVAIAGDAYTASTRALEKVEEIDDTIESGVATIEEAGTAQIELVQEEGTTQVENVNTAGTTQVGAVQAKGAEVINSIPADYTELTDEVSDLNQQISDVESSLDDISESNVIGIPITSETFEYTTEATLTETYTDNGVTLTFTETANPFVYYALPETVVGHNYTLTYDILSGNIANYLSQDVGILNPSTHSFNGIADPRTVANNVVTLVFTATSTQHTLRIGLVYSSKTVTLGNFKMVDSFLLARSIKNSAISGLEEERLSEELQAKINNGNSAYTVVNDLSFAKTANNYFDFTNASYIYHTADTIATFSENNIQLAFTETANPVVCFKIPNLFPNKQYRIKFAITNGNLNEKYCSIRKLYAEDPPSGLDLGSLTFTNHVCNTTFTVPSGENCVVMQLSLVYNSKNVTLSNVSVELVSDEVGRFIKDTAENPNKISASFIYNTNTGDCTILKIKGDTSDAVVMIDAMPNEVTAKTNIKAALDNSMISHVDYFILSHWHSDHWGCMEWLHDNGYFDDDTLFVLPEDPDDTSAGLIRDDNPDKEVIAQSEAMLANITEWGAEKKYPTEGEVISVNGCDFVFWNTDHSAYYAKSWVDYNECSLCCTMIYGNTVAQFTGDIGPAACTAYYDKLYKCNIFKANHHACGYAVVPKFMSAVFPEIVVTMAGSNVIYSTDPAVQAVFATLSNGLQAWCETEFVPNYVTGVIQNNIYMTINKNGFKFDSDARRCVRSDEGIPVSG